MSFLCNINQYYFQIFSTLTSCLIVLSALNPIHRMVWLIIVFVLGSFLFLFLDFIFLGLTYIIVYVGAIAILFLFVIMMIQIHNPITTRSIVFTDLQIPVLFIIIISTISIYLTSSNSFVIYHYPSWFTIYKNMTDIETLGYMIYVAYPSALIFLSILLWSVLIGVIKITMSYRDSTVV